MLIVKDFPDSVAQDFSRIIGLITEILDDGVKAGAFKQTTPVIVHLMAIGSMVFMKMSLPIRSKLASRVAASETVGKGLDREVADEIEDLILDAVGK